MDLVIEKIAAARERGLDITADMYTYIAGATGLNAHMPPWVQEGGYDNWVEDADVQKTKRKRKRNKRSVEEKVKKGNRSS